ncbi:MAG: radical SAM protein [Clostridia bacterium]|nr:radical SAM protein [Clostridia bacterium]
MSRRYIIPVFIPHRGCPHDCVFCNQKKISGFADEYDSDKIHSTITEHIKTFKGEKETSVQIAFYGGSFTALPIEQQTKLLQIAQKYIEQGAVDSIRLSTRPDYIDDVILDNLKKHDVKTIELGVQSLNDEVLRLSGRGHTAEAVYEAVQNIKHYGFELGLQMMTGLPGDNGDQSLFTAIEIANLKPQFARIYPTLVVKDTILANLYLEGKYKPFNLRKTVHLCKDILLIFKAKGVQVIRIGLQPTENINLNADVIAGPFHPSIGELVEGELLYDLFRNVFMDNNVHGLEYVEVVMNPVNLSKFIGNKKTNKRRFLKDFGIKNLTTSIDKTLDVNEYRVCFKEEIIHIDIDDIIVKSYKQKYGRCVNVFKKY